VVATGFGTEVESDWWPGVVARTAAQHQTRTGPERKNRARHGGGKNSGSKVNLNCERQQENKTHSGLTLQVKNPNKNSRSDARTRGTQQNAKTSFSLHSKQDYTEFAEVTTHPPSFLIGMKNRFLAHFYPRHYENEIGKLQGAPSTLGSYI
jgi:hypothetical protein